MQTSPILQLKISGTKKRLSESVLNESALTSLSICALLVLLTYSSKAILLGGSWGLIPVDIPVVSQPFNDTGIHNYKESPTSNIGASTFVVAVTVNELIYGDVSSFTAHKDDVRNKFLIPHKEGSPQVGNLLSQFGEWALDRNNRLGIRDDKLVIIIPDPGVPIAVLAGVVENLRSSGKFSHVVLGGGLL